MFLCVKAHVDAKVAAVAARQHGVFSLRQVWAVGGDADLARRRVAAGRWLRLDRGVFAIPGHPGTWEQRAMAATLGHPAAVLSGRPAAALWGLDGVGRGRPQVTVPRTTHHRSAIATVRRSDVVQRRVREGIAVNAPALVLVELAARSPVRAVAHFEDAVVKGVTDVGLLRDVHRRWAGRGVPGTAALGRFLESHADGDAVAESELELAGARLLTHPDIPAFEQQAPFPWAPSGPHRVDFLIPSWTMIVEVDGRVWHARLQDQDRDRARDLTAAAHGYLTIRLGYASVARDLVGTREDLIAAGRRRVDGAAVR